jgi:hypothetical protein
VNQLATAAQFIPVIFSIFFFSSSFAQAYDKQKNEWEKSGLSLSVSPFPSEAVKENIGFERMERMFDC